MVNSLLDLVRIWDNPVFHRFRRSQLRLKRSIAWLLLTLIVTTFVVSLTYILETNGAGMPEDGAARNLWIPLLVIQGLIVLLKGTGQTASGLIQDKIDQTLDYQRLTPVSPLRNIVGYLFGLPLLEYAMFALTLPHLAFVVVKGNIPLGTVFSVYLVFFVCAIFYHMTAIAVGMVMKRWVLGYLLSIFSVAFLNLFLPSVAPQLGLKFLQYLSIFPVIGQKVVPQMAVPQMGAPGQFGPPQQFGPQGPGGPFGPQGPQGPQGQPGLFDPPAATQGQASEGSFIEFAEAVPFFDWTLSPFVFTLLLQIGLIVTFATMAVRRWQKENKHSLSKPYALGILAAFIVLVTGNLWPAITGQYLPFSLIGQTRLEAVDEFLALGLPLVYAVTIWLLCLFLYANVVPAHHSYVRGVRRAEKLGRRMARPWEDDSASIAFMSLFAVVALVGYWVLYSRMSAAGFYAFLDGTSYSAMRLPFTLALVLMYSLLLIQALERRGTVLVVLVLWLVPILVAVVSAAAIEDLTSVQTVIASISPLAVIGMAGTLPVETVAPGNTGSEFEVILTGYRTGIAFLLVQTAVLAFRWAQVKKSLH